jgi:hypothetical protein
MRGCDGNGNGNGDGNDHDDDDANSDDDDDGSGDGDGGGVADSDCGATDNNQLNLQKRIRRARHDQDVLRRRLQGSPP